MRRFVAVVKAKSVEIQIIKFQNRNNMQKMEGRPFLFNDTSNTIYGCMASDNMIKCHTYVMALVVLYNCGA